MSDVKQVPPILTVIEDEGEYVIRASGVNGGRMAQAVLRDVAGASRVTFISDNDVKVFKNGKTPVPVAATVEEKAEVTPPLPNRRRIVQDESAPPAAELVEDYEAELRLQQAEAQKLAQQEQFQRQNAIQEEVEEPQVRKRDREQTIIAPTLCGRCAGTGKQVGETGFEGVCPVCQGKGEVKAWGRGRRRG